MVKGRVKYFDAKKGYGFIKPENGGNDIFFHISALEAAGIEILEDGQKIEYELIKSRSGKTTAGNLKLAGGTDDPGPMKKG